MSQLSHVQLQEKAFLFFNAYNRGSVSGMLALFSPESIISFTPLGETTGKGKVGDVGRFIWSMLFESFQNVHGTLLKSRFDEKGNLVCDVNVKGRQIKDFGDIKNKGKEFDNDHIFVFKFDAQGSISDMTVNWDHKDFAQKLN